MNKHIQLVTKWLDNPDSVTIEELKANADAAHAAHAAYHAERAAHAADDADSFIYAAHYAARAAYHAERAARDAVRYVKKYEELNYE